MNFRPEFASHDFRMHKNIILCAPPFLANQPQLTHYTPKIWQIQHLWKLSIWTWILQSPWLRLFYALGITLQEQYKSSIGLFYFSSTIIAHFLFVLKKSIPRPFLEDLLDRVHVFHNIMKISTKCTKCLCSGFQGSLPKASTKKSMNTCPVLAELTSKRDQKEVYIERLFVEFQGNMFKWSAGGFHGKLLVFEIASWQTVLSSRKQHATWRYKTCPWVLDLTSVTTHCFLPFGKKSVAAANVCEVSAPRLGGIEMNQNQQWRSCMSDVWSTLAFKIHRGGCYVVFHDLSRNNEDQVWCSEALSGAGRLLSLRNGLPEAGITAWSAILWEVLFK